jgi:hypothetical protein
LAGKITSISGGKTESSTINICPAKLMFKAVKYQAQRRGHPENLRTRGVDFA